MATIHDVALDANVSPTTVSRYINNRIELPAATAARIDAAIARLDYRPHVTDGAHGSILPGRAIRLAQAALVDLRPPEGRAMRTVAAVWPLAP